MARQNFIYRRKMKGKVAVGRWKAIDMGSALEFGATHTAEITPRYCPPEVARFLLRTTLDAPLETGMVDKAYASFDAWSAGVMLLELFDGGKNHVLLQRGLTEPRDVLEFVASPSYRDELTKRLDIVLRPEGATGTLRSVIADLLGASERERCQAVPKALQRSVFTNKDTTFGAASIMQKQLGDLVEQNSRIEAKLDKGFDDISAHLASLKQGLILDLEQLVKAAAPPAVPLGSPPAVPPGDVKLLDLRPQQQEVNKGKVVDGLLDFRTEAQLKVAAAEAEKERKRVELVEGLLDLRKLGNLSAEGVRKADRAKLQPQQVKGMLDQMKGLGQRLWSLGEKAEPSGAGVLNRTYGVISTDHSHMARQLDKAVETADECDKLELLHKVMEKLDSSLSAMSEQFNDKLDALAKQYASSQTPTPQQIDLQVRASHSLP
jgi:hypothetical protein